MKAFPSRPCPICLGSQSRLLFKQTFSAYSEGGLMEGYDLVVCDQCGAAFANGIPGQKVFDKYYAQMSKYEHSHREGMISPVDSERFRQVADLLSPHVKLNERVVDVGCATGGLLAELKRRGYKNIIGFDPSPACAATAKRLYDIEVVPVDIGAMDQGVNPFDVVILTGVLEHLCDVDASLRSLTGLLKPGGRLYLEVPDASKYQDWFSAPYQFFSMEHVNFFSPQSLVNLLARHGYECVFVERVKRFLGPRAVEPAIAGLFLYSKKMNVCVRDTETGPALLEYLAFSRLLEERIMETISGFVKSQAPLAVWGAGTHTLRLMETSPLPEANIIAFLDSNPRYQGKTIRGIPILAPEKFARPDASILISSHVAEQEIKDQIKHQFCWRNEVFCLYNRMPVERT